jgi:hypothetical protein
VHLVLLVRESLLAPLGAGILSREDAGWKSCKKTGARWESRTSD